MLTWDPGHWEAALFSFIPALLNIGICIDVFFYTSRRPLNVLFTLFLLSVISWQLSDTLMRLSADKESADFWMRLLGSPVFLLVSFWFHFSLVFTKRLKWAASPWVLILNYVPGVAFMLLCTAGASDAVYSKDAFWGFLPKITPSPFNHISGIWISAMALATLLVFVLFIIQARSAPSRQRSQAILISIGFAIPTFQGITTELIFPLVLDINPVPLTSGFISAFSVCAFIAMTRYRLLSYSPLHAWSYIMKQMHEGLVILDMDRKVRYSNDGFEEQIGLQKDFLVNRRLDDVVDHFDRTEVLLEQIASMDPRQPAMHLEMPLRIVDGKVLWTLWNITPYKDRHDCQIGYICLVEDISWRKRKEAEILATVIQTQERERSRIASDLHDGICQDLTAAKMLAETLWRRNGKKDPDDLHQRLFTLLRESLGDARSISHSLMPRVLKESGLRGALESLADTMRQSLSIVIQCDAQENLCTPAIEVGIYRITQELIQNTLKYAHAGKVWVHLSLEGGYLKYVYQDDGVGMDLSTVFAGRDGIGLGNINARVKALQGDIHWESARGEGMSVTIKIGEYRNVERQLSEQAGRWAS